MAWQPDRRTSAAANGNEGAAWATIKAEQESNDGDHLILQACNSYGAEAHGLGCENGLGWGARHTGLDCILVKGLASVVYVSVPAGERDMIPTDHDLLVGCAGD